MQPILERKKTDDGLQQERLSTDEALETRRVAPAAKPDAENRKRTDDAQTAARERTDSELRASDPGSESAAIADERARSDEALIAERHESDAARRRDRREQLEDLARLLMHDREATDECLLIERDRSDAALASRDDFLGIVCHDLRNLVFSVGLRARKLSLGAPPTADAATMTTTEAKAIERSVTQMSKLLDDLVDVVSIDAGKLAIRRERANVADVLVDATDAFAGAASAKGVRLNHQAVPDAWVADFDRNRLLQVFGNLISNAIKFTPRGGEIMITGALTGEEIRLAVQDSGAGMPSDTLERIFDRFWQVDAKDRRGLGLGLYIARTIVEAHGGKIWAESTAGAGSTFFVTLPNAPN